MKNPCLFFLMICYAALTPGAAFADPPTSTFRQTSPESAAIKVSDHPQGAEQTIPTGSTKHPKDGKPSDERRDHRYVSDKDHPRSPATIAKDRTKHIPKNQQRSSSGIARNLHQPGSDKSRGAAKGGLIQHETTSPPRLPSVVRPSAPQLNNVRHRGLNTPVIGGPANSHSRNAGAINGTGLHRRP